MVSTAANLRADFLNLVSSSLRALRGEQLVSEHLSQCEEYKHILAVGKAASSMMTGALAHNPTADALLITKYDHIDPQLEGFPNLRTIQSGHPLPDQNSIEAGHAVQDFCSRLTDEPVLCLISGGASALVELPRPDYSLADIQALNQKLLTEKIPIAEMNLQRTRLSQLKGGGLARMLSRNRILALYLSDVPDNDTATIGSGLLKHPTAPHPNLREHILADNAVARATAATLAAKKYKVRCHHTLLDTAIEEVAESIGSQLYRQPGVLHIWGGEPLVELPAQAGRGGRNQHLALLLAARIAGDRDACFLSLGTDGTDGNTSYAGGVVTHRSYAELKDHSYAELLAGADSSRGLAAIDGILETGPTGTNLMDLILGYVSPMP